MRRLVDVNEVLKAVDKHTKDCSEIVLDNDISCILEEVPTAYDVEKVVEKIEELAEGVCCKVLECAYKNTIDIVKRGGVE